MSTKVLPAMQSAIFGKRHGNFLRASYPTKQAFIDAFTPCFETSGKRKLAWLRIPSSPNRITLMEDKSLTPCGSCGDFGVTLATRIPADAILMRSTDVAVVVLSADCPSVVIWEVDGDKVVQWAVVHAGLNRIYPEYNSILDEVLSDYFPNPRQTHAFVGMSIGPCCYGVDGLVVTGQVNLKDCFGVAHAGPRRGQSAMDLPSMLKAQLEKFDLRTIKVAAQCTACHGRETDDDRGGDYWSHAWDDCLQSQDGSEGDCPAAGRNCCLFWVA